MSRRRRIALTLVKPPTDRDPTAEEIARLWETLTGKTATPADLEEIRAELERDDHEEGAAND
jgi:hypothetical protein